MFKIAWFRCRTLFLRDRCPNLPSLVRRNETRRRECPLFKILFVFQNTVHFFRIPFVRDVNPSEKKVFPSLNRRKETTQRRISRAPLRAARCFAKSNLSSPPHRSLSRRNRVSLLSADLRVARRIGERLDRSRSRRAVSPKTSHSSAGP